MAAPARRRIPRRFAAERAGPRGLRAAARASSETGRGGGRVKRFEVSFRPQAEADLFGLYRYIAAEAGLEVAGAYIGRIEAACLSLETFPERGTRRDDIRPGLRTIGFEGRATIV